VEWWTFINGIRRLQRSVLPSDVSTNVMFNNVMLKASKFGNMSVGVRAY
jgi:hypothetical protein